jgi:peroxiredoxin
MAKTPRASKVSDATTSGRTKPAKTTAAEQAAAADRAPAPKKGSTKKASKKQEAAPAPKKAAKQREAAAAQAPAGKKAAKKAATSAEAPAGKKAAKKTAASAQAPAPKKAAKKKTASAEAPAPKKAAKKTAASAQAPAPKKAAKKKAASAQAPAPKKAAKKKAALAPVSEQLAFSMDVDVPASDSAPAPARPLQPGDRVPDFSLQADDGQTYSRQSLAGERFVIYFYPKDDTPGCTREACAFRDNRPRFDAAGVKVLGVSGDSLKSHDRFRTKYELNFPLLADPDRTVAQAFGAVGAKKLYGKTSVGIIRSTFLVGPEGVVERTFAPVKVDGHAEAVLQAIG